MAGKVKWVAVAGVYAIDRVEETPIQVAYRGTDGKAHGMIDGTRIIGYAGTMAVVAVSIAGSHPMTRANYRAKLAAKVQDAGGSWMGRSHETETAKADARCDVLHNGAGDYTEAERKQMRNRYYGGIPHPSDY